MAVTVSIDLISRALDKATDNDPSSATINRAYPFSGSEVCAALIFVDSRCWPKFLEALAIVDGITVDLLRQKETHRQLDGHGLVRYFPGVRFVGLPCPYDEEEDE